jgi:hypothetical protein
MLDDCSDFVKNSYIVIQLEAAEVKKFSKHMLDYKMDEVLNDGIFPQEVVAAIKGESLLNWLEPRALDEPSSPVQFILWPLASIHRKRSKVIRNTVVGTADDSDANRRKEFVDLIQELAVKYKFEGMVSYRR